MHVLSATKNSNQKQFEKKLSGLTVFHWYFLFSKFLHYEYHQVYKKQTLPSLHELTQWTWVKKRNPFSEKIQRLECVFHIHLFLRAISLEYFSYANKYQNNYSLLQRQTWSKFLF